MPELIAFIDSTEIGYLVTLCCSGAVIQEIMIEDDEEAEWYAETFMAQNGIAFPDDFSSIH